MELSYILLFMTIGFLLWLYITHIQLIKKRNKALEAFSSVDVQLKKRYDLIPNLVSIAKGYMNHEKAIFEKITELRTQAMKLSSRQETIKRKININNEISDGLGQIAVQFENYPDLKANTTMLNLMRTLTDVEEHIAAARRFYNSAVNELNNAVEIFPSNIVAKMMGIKVFEFFEAKAVERENVNIA